jgi:hypothetical protein
MLSAVISSSQTQQEKTTIQVRILISNSKETSSCQPGLDDSIIVEGKYQFNITMRLPSSSDEHEVELCKAIVQCNSTCAPKLHKRQGQKTQVT